MIYLAEMTSIWDSVVIAVMMATNIEGEEDVKQLEEILQKAGEIKIPEVTHSRQNCQSDTPDPNLTFNEAETRPKADNDPACFLSPRTSKQVEILCSARELSESNRMHDVYSQISKKSQSIHAKNTSFEDTEDNKTVITTKDIALSMKRSDQIWLQKASKWAEASGGAPTLSAENTEEVEKDYPAAGNFEQNMLLQDQQSNKKESLLDWERKKLVSEMLEKEKEDRLLKIKNLSYQRITGSCDSSDQTSKGEKLKDPIANQQNADAASVLIRLGVGLMNQSELENKIMINEGWVDDQVSTSKGGNRNMVQQETPEDSSASQDANIVYGDSVEGFVTTKKYDVISANNENNAGASIPYVIGQDTYDKLNMDDNENASQTEGDQLTEKELYALQETLAQEKELLVAERKKGERITAASLTDQMYEECQQLLQLFGVPWVVSPGKMEVLCYYV